ncbi:MAG: molybdopterin-binding protein [Selenomonas noxia]
MGAIRGLYIAEKRGMQKQAMDRVFFVTKCGIDGDADAAGPDRQVSLLGLDETDGDSADSAAADYAAFGKNIIADGFRFKELSPGTRLRVGDVFLEITKNTAAPYENAYARVLHGGWVTVGDTMELAADPIPLDAAVVTASDEELSTAAIRQILTEGGCHIAGFNIVSDRKEEIARALTIWADCGVGLVLAAGGADASAGDVLPAAVREVAAHTAPDILATIMRLMPPDACGGAAAGTYKRTLIVYLPGSGQGACTCLKSILPELRRSVAHLRGDADKDMQPA